MFCAGIQARVWLAIRFFFRRQYQWPFCHRFHHVRIPHGCWWGVVSRVVLADLRLWVHVHRRCVLHPNTILPFAPMQ